MRRGAFSHISHLTFFSHYRFRFQSSIFKLGGKKRVERKYQNDFFDVHWKLKVFPAFLCLTFTIDLVTWAYILFCFYGCRNCDGGVYVCVPVHVYVCICAHKLVLFMSIDDGYHK